MQSALSTTSVQVQRPERPRVVIIGAGFGGLEAAKALKDAPIDLTVIDRQNHHCFQPLLYQVATAALSPADVAWPIRSILSGQTNTRVVMAEVTGIDRDRRVVTTSSGAAFAYDFLILATGSTPSYFGHDEWALFAPGLKRIEDAVRIRRRILEAFELAELADDPAEQRRLLTFVIIGGGPTGVELAGAIAEIARYALARDFRRINPRSSQIVLVEAGPRLLPQFPESLSAYAERELNRMGVKTLTHTAVRNCSASSVQLGENTVSAGTLIWAAGVKAAGPAHHLGVEVDRAGRIKVDQNLMLPGDGAVYVIGDTALVLQGNTAVPGLAPAAKQMGRYAADAIVARLSGNEVAPFKYRHYGDLATIGRKSAVVAISGLKLRGFLAWAFWGAVHIFYLLGVRNRLVVLLDWLWAYVTFERGARLIEKAEN